MSHAVLIFRFLMQKLLRDWGRILILAVLAALAIVIAVVIRSNADGGPTAEDGATFIVWYGLSVILPFGALLISSEALGDLREERTLVYLWLRPVRALAATGGAAAAAFVVVFALLVVPLIVAGLILDVPAAAGATLAAVGYTGVFLAFGLVLSRPLLIGLLSLLVWENVIGSLGAATARLTIPLLRRQPDRRSGIRRGHSRGTVLRRVHRGAAGGGGRRPAVHRLALAARGGVLSLRGGVLAHHRRVGHERTHQPLEAFPAVAGTQVVAGGAGILGGDRLGAGHLDVHLGGPFCHHEPADRPRPRRHPLSAHRGRAG